MSGKHQPNSEFVEKLEGEINREVRRRNRSAQAPQVGWMPRWMPQSRGTAALALMGLMLVSMGLGGAAVAAAYQAQGNQRRDVLLSGFERRADLARAALKIATDKQRDTERQVSLGLANQEHLLEGRAKVTEADALLKSIESQIEEVRITGREPLSEISSPLVSGRDFVSERLRIQMSVPQAAIEIAQLRLRDTEKRVSLGLENVSNVDVARSQTVEIDTAVEGFQKKIEIRQMFLARKIDAATAELRVQEVEAGQRKKILAPKVELARKELENTSLLVRKALAPPVNQAEAALRLQQLETDLALANLDLLRVHAQLDQHGAGR